VEKILGLNSEGIDAMENPQYIKEYPLKLTRPIIFLQDDIVWGLSGGFVHAEQLKGTQKKNLLPVTVDPFHAVGDRLPALFAHERAVTEFQVRNLEPFSGNGIHLPDNERLFTIAFHVHRDGLPAVMDGDLDHDVLDRPAPECRDRGCLCPFHPLFAAFDCRDLNAKGIVSALGNHMVFHIAFIFFGKLDTADPGHAFAGNDRFYQESLRFAFFWDPLVVAAGRAPDEQVAGFGDNFVLGLVFAFGAGGGDKH
jgi:hypothetical protein